MELKITRDVTGESRSDSSVQNYVELFQDRLERLREVISDGKLPFKERILKMSEHPIQFFTIGQKTGLRGDEI